MKVTGVKRKVLKVVVGMYISIVGLSIVSLGQLLPNPLLLRIGMILVAVGVWVVTW